MILKTKQLTGRARELAARLAASLGNRHLVEEFVEAYVKEFDRPGLIEEPARHRELLDVLTREALLVMFARIQAQLPRHLTRRRPPVLEGPEVRAAEAFQQEATAGVARALHWGPEEAEAFRRDLALYAQVSARQPALASHPAEAGPFVDRTALLLDPSFMEKAQRAAGEFLQVLEALAEQALNAAFRSRPKH